MSKRSIYQRSASTRGQAIIGQFLLAMLLLTVVFTFIQWNSQLSKAGVRQLAVQKALANAESGIATALETLRRPEWTFALPAGGSLPPITRIVDERGSFAVTISRDAEDASLLTAISTGYFEVVRGGNALDLNNRPAQMAVVFAQIRARSMADFFAVVPGSLQISYGTDISSGSVYARDLSFMPGDPALPRTRVQSAYYYTSLQPLSPQSFVDFLATPNKPVRMKVEPNLVAVDASLRSIYKTWAGSDQLAAEIKLDGDLADSSDASNRYNIFFCSGNVHLATQNGTTSSSLNILRPTVIFATGNVYIYGNIQPTVSGGWLAVITEGNIVFKAIAPDQLHIEGTFMSGGSIFAENASRPSDARLEFNGGFQAQTGVNFGSTWPNRSYSYEPPPENIMLPFFLDIEAYNILRGRTG